MSQPRTDSPAMAHVFRCARSTHVTYWVAIVGALGLASVVLLARKLVFERWYFDVLAAAVFVAYAAECGLGLVRARAVYVLFDQGVVRRAPGRAERSVLWPEVAAVRERPLLRRLELLDARGERLLVLDAAVVDYGRLKRLVLERTRPFRAAPAAPEAELAAEGDGVNSASGMEP